MSQDPSNPASLKSLLLAQPSIPEPGTSWPTSEHMDSIYSQQVAWTPKPFWLKPSVFIPGHLPAALSMTAGV